MTSKHKAGRPGFVAFESKSTWSSFDDITWDDDFPAGDDHSVPDPDEVAITAAISRKKEAALNKLSQITPKLTKQQELKLETTDMEVDNWDVADLSIVPENLVTRTCKEEGNVGLFNEEDASAVTSTCNFSFTDVATEGDIGLFGTVNEVDKGGTLLQYAWENLDDMNDIFQNGETTFVQDIQDVQDTTDALLQWPSSSASPESNADVKAASGTPLRAMKGKLHDQDVKMEFIPCESSFENKEICASNSEDDTSGAGRMEEQSGTTNDKILEVSETAAEKPVELSRIEDKAHPSKRLAVNRRLEKFKKQSSHQKKTPSDYSKPVSQFQSGQPLQLKPSVASNLQVYPPMVPPNMLSMQQRSQPLPYVHTSYGMVHHAPYILPQQAPQQVVMGFQPQPVVNPETRHHLDVLTPPPVSGSNMTPQEKIEKLRWKQKMNRLASEQHQMVKQCSNVPPSMAKEQQEKLPSNVEVLKLEEDGNVVDTAVLNQLLGIMSKLDVGTRICIRDALYRLSKSAMCRQTSDGSSSSERSPSRPESSERNHLSRHFGLPLLETVTNPIDRTMANLLFYRGSMLENQSPWIWPQQQQPQQQQQQQHQQHQHRRHQQEQKPAPETGMDYLKDAECSDAGKMASTDGHKDLSKHGVKRDSSTNCSEFWDRAKRSSSEQQE